MSTIEPPHAAVREGRQAAREGPAASHGWLGAAVAHVTIPCEGRI
jgi:hypothetical protein